MSGDGNDLASNYHVTPQSYSGSLPAASGFSEILHPGPGLPAMTHPCIGGHNSQVYTNHSPYVSSQLDSLAAAAHLNSVYIAGLHGAPQMLMHTNPHFIHTNQPPSLAQITRQPQSIKQGLPFIEQEPELVLGGPPFTEQRLAFVPAFIKQEPGLAPGLFIKQDRDLGHPFIKQEPGLAPGLFIKQDRDLPPGGHPFIKQEPGLAPGPFIKQDRDLPPGGHPFIKQEPGLAPVIKQDLIGGVSKEFSVEDSRYVSSFLDMKPGAICGNGTANQERQVGLGKVDTCGYKLVKQEGAGEEFAAFPSQPLHLNFMADIEDIIQPSNCEVSIDCIQRELSGFEGPSGFKQNVVKEEEEDPTWEPPLWKQQYENIRTMRSKRDAPVDKYGCFMNAETEVAPEVRRYQVLISLMLSSQTKDEVVGKAMIKLKENGLTISNVLNTPQEEIARMIFPVGFWNKKSEYIKKTTKLLDEKFSGDIPNSVEGLVSLPGIGPKMAHLIMDFAWGEVSGIAVDTHVHRITHRLGWMRKETRNPEEARKHLEKWIPKSEWSALNLLCVGFGQQICSPVGPKCSDCLNKDLCPSSSCLVNSSQLPLGMGFEMSTKSKGKKAKSNSASAVKTKKIKIEK